MDISTQFSSIKVVSTPKLGEIGDSKVLRFFVDNDGQRFEACMWGRYAEITSKYLRKGHELHATGRAIPSGDGKFRFVLDRTFLKGSPLRTMLNNLSLLKEAVLTKAEEMCPFQRKTPEEPVPTEQSLVDMILEWWEENKYEEYCMGDGEYDNLYSEEPDFVTEARNIKEEVTIE